MGTIDLQRRTGELREVGLSRKRQRRRWKWRRRRKRRRRRRRRRRWWWRKRNKAVSSSVKQAAASAADQSSFSSHTVGSRLHGTLVIILKGERSVVPGGLRVTLIMR